MIVERTDGLASSGSTFLEVMLSVERLSVVTLTDDSSSGMTGYSLSSPISATEESFSVSVAAPAPSLSVLRSFD